MGSAARLGEESSPTRISRLISRPTTRKKTAISPSLIQWVKSLVREKSPNPMVSFVCHSSE
jgi:hypothetical protein